jgi:hypothetical protein
MSCVSIIHCSKVTTHVWRSWGTSALTWTRVSAGALVRNNGATNVAPTQKKNLSSKNPHFKTHKWSWNVNLVMGPETENYVCEGQLQFNLSFLGSISSITFNDCSSISRLTMNSTILWEVTQCCLVEIYWRFRGTYWQAAGSKQKGEHQLT